ncbi:MAG: bile acid:sodium symporter [Parvibaculum sp.]|uniref:bile acid:sodium symporter family protein n=1 Tax=Parvibaculum sp. TaxID=2024848 RepID=UPI0025E257EC|nr:bile acid:sodium symporter family protein [Parvibaculum sp.]MCE9648215.1 bile acid:sodium symporter [Parvibaculum sp.]
MLAKLKLDGFLVSLLGVVALAVVWPAPGATGSPLHVEWISTYGISIVFFLYGLTLAPEKMRAGFAKWRVHAAVQLGTFALFPAVVLALLFLVSSRLPAEVSVGFFYLAALPGTVSSAVAMTSLARGNVPVAIFNATASSFLGVFLTPLLMAWYLNTTGHTLPLGAVILKIVMLVLVPIGAGQIAHRWLAGWASRNSAWLKLIDRGVILAIVYNSFCDSILAGIWSAHDITLLIEMIGGAIALFFLIYALMKVVCRIMGFNREDTIACLFCASKKSLATGVPLSKVMFGATPALGLIIAPLMIFHFFQLVIVSVIANRFAHDGAQAEAAS